MPPDSERTARDLFDELVECEPSERACRLTDLDVHAPALAKELRSLLEAFDRSNAFLDRPALATPGTIDELVATAGEADATKESIGPWRLIGRLGTGGMGEVHLAERVDGSFHREVAVKLVRSEIRSAGAVARFRRERALLAKLDHPNVARLLDGGVTPEGRPYLVMELVRGERIDRWCDRTRASIEARLELFLQVCAAVAHAHRHLIVHRDLKPGNVLVTDATEGTDEPAGSGALDGGGRVKLVDFGIAKLLGEGDAELAATLTMTSAPAFTPRYAAPEQLLGGNVTTATDIHALGVLLYELLCGRHPHPVQSWERMRETIREIDPAPPSRRVDDAERGATATADPTDADAGNEVGTDQDGDAETIAALRGATAAQLRRRLAGDLDTIVLKAMRKNPSSRYATVEAFADDLRRHMAGEAVLARSATIGERFRRFVRRNRVVVGVVSIVVVTLTAGTAVAIAGLLRAVEATRLAERAAVEATRQERATRLVLEFLAEDLVAAASIDSQHAYDVPMRELLELAAIDVQTRFGDDPALRSAIELMVGRMFFGLSMHDAAAVHLESAFAWRAESSTASAEERFDATIALVELRIAQGKFDDAEMMLSSEAFVDVSPQQKAMLANGRGYLRIIQGRFDDALPHLDEAIRRADAVSASESLLFLANRAWTLHGLGRYAEAIAQYREVLEAQRQLHGETHFRVLRTTNNLGHALIDGGLRDEAEVLLRSAIEVAERSLPDDHPLRLTLDNNLALSLGQDRLAEVLELFESVLRRQSTRLSPDDPALLRTRNNVAMSRLALGEIDSAVEELREIHARRASALGAEHPSAIATLANIAYALYLAERHRDAAPLYRETIALRERALGPTHPVTVSTLRFAAENLVRAGDPGAAAELLREAIRRAPEAYGDEPQALQTLATMLERAEAAARSMGDLSPTGGTIEKGRSD